MYKTCFRPLERVTVTAAADGNNKRKVKKSSRRRLMLTAKNIGQF